MDFNKTIIDEVKLNINNLLCLTKTPDEKYNSGFDDACNEILNIIRFVCNSWGKPSELRELSEGDYFVFPYFPSSLCVHRGVESKVVSDAIGGSYKYDSCKYSFDVGSVNPRSGKEVVNLNNMENDDVYFADLNCVVRKVNYDK